MAQKPPQAGHFLKGKKHMTNTSGFFRDARVDKPHGNCETFGTLENND